MPVVSLEVHTWTLMVMPYATKHQQKPTHSLLRPSHSNRHQQKTRRVSSIRPASRSGHIGFRGRNKQLELSLHHEAMSMNREGDIMQIIQKLVIA